MIISWDAALLAGSEFLAERGHHTSEDTPMANVLSDKEVTLIDAYWRAAHYLSVGQIYLYDNPLLKKSLTQEHIKPPLLGPPGTTPRVDFLYLPLHPPVKKHDLDKLYP